MCQDNAYIKGMSLGFLANRIFGEKNSSLSLLHASSPPSLLFHAQELGVSFSTRQEVMLCDFKSEDRGEEEENY